MNIKNRIGAVWVVCSLLGCSHTPPTGVQAVTSFNSAEYSGLWYEVARLDHSFERGMSRVTAQYLPNPDGSIKVINRGFVDAKNKWKEIIGRAKPVHRPDIAHLKVSFFGPFYGDYIVFDLDKDYQHALVSGPNHSYLWILSRKPNMSDEQFKLFKEKAMAAGFDASRLIRVAQ